VAVGAYFVGHSTGSTSSNGPSTLADALVAARTGTLPCGSTATVSASILNRLCNGSLSAISGGTGGGTTATTGAGPTGAGRGRGLMVGTVTAASGNQVTIQTGQGPVTLTVGTDAAVRTTTAGTTADLATGTRVVLTAPGATGVRQVVVLRAGRAGSGTPPSS
jgi:hypothetical protein